MYLLNAIEVAKADYHIAENEAKSDKNYSGIFESMACINNQIPLLAFHLQRIFRSSPESEKQNILSDIANLKLPKNAVVKYQLIYSPLTSEYTRLINITHPRDYPSDYWQTGVDVCLSALRLSIIIGITVKKMFDVIFMSGRVKNIWILVVQRLYF